jgi:hypothetical protein
MAYRSFQEVLAGSPPAHAEERLAGTGWLPDVLRRKLPEADAPEIAAAA